MSGAATDHGTGGVDRMALAEQCRALSLSPHGEDLARAAVELHLAGNDGSGERWDTDQDYRERAEMGYRAEIAVAEWYGLDPEIDYRPPGVGDSGHDFRARVRDEVVTIDVKATRTVPPKLYLTQKRAWSDRYQLPDAYLLCATELTDDDRIHLVGWARTETVQEEGEETTVYGNDVWRLDGLDLSPPPARVVVEPLTPIRREVWSAADRADLEIDARGVADVAERMAIVAGDRRV